MSNKTGIVLFVYNRPYHTKKVLEGLKKNNISKLYIFSDGSKNEKDKTQVKEVRNLIRNIDWCETEIHINLENKGLANSIVAGVNYVLNKHERIIVLEDDCVPSPDFVSFMEKCFDKYENNQKIMSISGFSPPIKIPEDYKYDIYFSYRPCSSGWGTWKRAWNFFQSDNNLQNKIKESRDFRKRVFLAGKDLIPMLEKQIKGENDSWAVFWSLNIIENNGICINPVHSRIINIGFDNSGIHSKTTNKFNVNLYKGSPDNLIFPDRIIVNNKIIKRYRSFYVPPVKDEFKLKIIRMMKFLKLYNFLKRIKNSISGENNESSAH
jgi:hypothetical protein